MYILRLVRSILQYFGVIPVLVSNIGEIRNDHDANLTYEGENHVLIQQTSNWLLKLWPSVLEGKKISTPLHSIDFLTNGLDILRGRFTATNMEEACQLESKSFYEIR